MQRYQSFINAAASKMFSGEFNIFTVAETPLAKR